MKREIKFRAWNSHTKKMIDLKKITPLALDPKLGECDGLFLPFQDIFILMQFTGHNVDGKELYESDILREEVATDEGDDRSYYVVVWIKEWAMFATLSIEEYFEYQMKGADGLDSTMFWTFPIEEKDNATKKICGNIHQNPDLLTQHQVIET